MKRLADYGFKKVNSCRWENEYGYIYHDDFGDWYVAYKGDYETTKDGSKVLDIYDALVEKKPLNERTETKMEREQREADRLNDMNGLTEEARKAINETPLNMLEEFWGGFKSAEEINLFVETMYEF